jgi:hypothetical protein
MSLFVVVRRPISMIPTLGDGASNADLDDENSRKSSFPLAHLLQLYVEHIESSNATANILSKSGGEPSELTRKADARHRVSYSHGELSCSSSETTRFLTKDARCSRLSPKDPTWPHFGAAHQSQGPTHCIVEISWRTWMPDELSQGLAGCLLVCLTQ